MQDTVDAKEASNRTITHIIYGLYASSVLLGVTAIVAIVMNYIKKDDVAGTWLESHFRWQIRTFWFGLLWSFVCALLTMVVVGVFGFIALAIWYIYRIAKGWINLADNKPMYQ
jgi:uncharacterized membrane protein